MRFKNYKKNACIFMFIALCFVFVSSFVYAAEDENCTVYEDYYFFIQTTSTREIMIAGEQNEDAKIDANGNWSVTGNTYFPTFVDKDAMKNLSGDLVCVYKTNATECSAFQGYDASKNKAMSMSDFYTLYKKALSSTTTHGSGKAEARYHEEKKDGKVTRYITHGSWNDGQVEHDGKVNIFSITGSNNIQAIVNASFVPSSVSVKMTYNDSSIYAETVRSIPHSQLATKIGETSSDFQVKWSGETKTAIMSPAMFYDTYTYCDTPEPEDVIYKAKINYLYKDTKKEAAAPFSKDYYDGSTDKITSPTIAGCTPDLSTVDVVINGKDFSKTVYYTCAVAQNPKTGSALFIACMIIGFSSLGYFLYWLFIGRKKYINEV